MFHDSLASSLKKNYSKNKKFGFFVEPYLSMEQCHLIENELKYSAPEITGIRVYNGETLPAQGFFIDVDNNTEGLNR